MSLQRCKNLLKEMETELSKSCKEKQQDTAAVPPSVPSGSFPCASSGSSVGDTSATSMFQEHRRLFGFRPQTNRYQPYTKSVKNKNLKANKRATFTRNFVCLSHMEDTVPPSPSQQSALKKAGLGEKKITLHLDDGPFQINDILKDAYPQLSNSGGYVLLRILERGRRVLSVINGPYSCEQLRDAVGQGKIYIRPLQRDLNLDPLPTNDNCKVEDLQEKCLNCQQMFFLAELADHIEKCCKTSNTATNSAAHTTTTNSNTTMEASTGATVNSATTEDQKKVDVAYFVDKYGQGVVSEVKCPKCGRDVEVHSAGTYASDSGSLRIYAEDEEFVCTNPGCQHSDGDHNNLEHAGTEEVGYQESDIHAQSTDKVSGSSGVDPDISDVVAQTLEYCAKHKITNAVEVLRYYQSTMVTGRPLNVVDQSQASEGATNYILVDRYNIVETAFDEIKGLVNLRLTLEVQFYGEEAEDIGGPRREFFRLIVKEIFKIYFENGLKPHMANDYHLIGVIFGLSLIQDGKVPKFKEELFESVFDSSVNNNPCLTLLPSGLKKTGIFQLAMNIDGFKDFFREGPKAAMTMKTLNGVLKPVFSEAGSNARKGESLVYRKFQMYLREVASGRRSGLDLGSVLQFTTGCDEEPILGFSIDPSVTFYEVTNSFLPTANTCSNTLHLPRPARDHELPEKAILFELYDMAFKSAYFGNK